MADSNPGDSLPCTECERKTTAGVRATGIGSALGILPGADASEANEYVSIAVATGLVVGPPDVVAEGRLGSGVLTDGLAAVEAACGEALRDGVQSSAVILNILARRREAVAPEPVLTPAALRLQHEPAADCARYDSLRRSPDGTP